VPICLIHISSEALPGEVDWYTDVDAQCDKLATVDGQTSTVASSISSVVVGLSLSHLASIFIKAKFTMLATVDGV